MVGLESSADAVPLVRVPTAAESQTQRVLHHICRRPASHLAKGEKTQLAQEFCILVCTKTGLIFLPKVINTTASVLKKKQFFVCIYLIFVRSDVSSFPINDLYGPFAVVG